MHWKSKSVSGTGTRAHAPNSGVPVVAPRRHGRGLPEAAVPSCPVVEDGGHEARHHPLAVGALHAHRRGRLRGHGSHRRRSQNAAVTPGAGGTGIDLGRVGSIFVGAYVEK